MSQTERHRAAVLARVVSKELTLRAGAVQLGLSYRQAKRLHQRFLASGAPGLVHRSVGQPSHRAVAPPIKAQALAIVAAQYGGRVGRGAGQRLGPTFAAEQLATAHGIVVDAETLRRWMLAACLWSSVRKHAPHRMRRTRRAQFGALVQLDGSFHDWFEGRQPVAEGARSCLLTMIDDATSQVCAQFSAEETTWDAARLLQRWIATSGVPVALYTDWKNVYVRKPTVTEQAHGLSAVTAFGAMCARLGIAIIAADSPQAKGRVERSHGTDQDRLIKAMRLAGVSSRDAGNAYLREVYLAARNARLTVCPVSPIDAHRAWDPTLALHEVYYLESTRRLSQDWVVQYQTRLFQVMPRHDVPVKSQVRVRETEDGTVRLVYVGRTGAQPTELTWLELPAGASRTVTAPPAVSCLLPPQAPALSSRRAPATTHPFRRFFPVSEQAIAQERQRVQAGALPFGRRPDTPMKQDEISPTGNVPQKDTLIELNPGTV